MRKVNPNPHPAKFLHLRYAEDDGSVCNQGGTTIAWRPSDVKPNKIEVAIARCRTDENFCRRIGRNVALGQLKYYNFYYLDKKEDQAEQERELFEFAARKAYEQEELAMAQRERHAATIQ